MGGVKGWAEASDLTVARWKIADGLPTPVEAASFTSALTSPSFRTKGPQRGGQGENTHRDRRYPAGPRAAAQGREGSAGLGRLDKPARDPGTCTARPTDCSRRGAYPRTLQVCVSEKCHFRESHLPLPSTGY